MHWSLVSLRFGRLPNPSDVGAGEHTVFLDAQVVLVALAPFELGRDDAEVALLSLQRNYPRLPFIAAQIHRRTSACPVYPPMVSPMSSIQSSTQHQCHAGHPIRRLRLCG